MAYYAHSVFGRPEAEWEPLARHLVKVEEGAGRLGRRFGAEDLAALAGRLHDLGKYGPDFQARLRGSTKPADHSTAGAVWAFEHLSECWGRLLAHVVAGHHAGLKDDLLGPEGRIESKSLLLPPVERAARADGLTLPQSVSGPTGMKPLKGNEGFQLAFLTACAAEQNRKAA